MKRRIFIIAGFASVGMGTLGMFLPLLPTTPFLLLAAYCFARGSDRWYRWLLRHKQLGPYIHAFRNKTGLTRAQKLRIGASFTVLMGVSFYCAPLPTVRALLAVLWLFWTVVLLRMKTLRDPSRNADP
jgi:hypothetical protein